MNPTAWLLVSLFSIVSLQSIPHTGGRVTQGTLSSVSTSKTLQWFRMVKLEAAHVAYDALGYLQLGSAVSSLSFTRTFSVP